jgi:HK97 gp10 family phage protein
MASKVTVRVEGLSQLGERMRLLNRQMSQKIARRATNAAAQVIKKKAKADLRANPSIDTGLLEKNVVVRKARGSKLTSEHVVGVRRVVYPQVGGSKTKRDTVQVGGYLEFGTVKMANEAWLAPAFDTSKDEALQQMVQTINDGLDKAGA